METSRDPSPWRNPPPRTAPLAAGVRLDRYELLSPLAGGVTASAWLARLSGKHGFEKLVVVKAVSPELARDARFRATFLEEARVASSVRHGNVAQILDLGEEGEVLYVVTEWIDGDSLLTLKTTLGEKGVPFPPGLALRILGDACGGLHAAHELGRADVENRPVLHRDVSPKNLLVNTQGVAKVIDFGTGKAKSRAREAPTPRRATARTHRIFTSPEQAQGGVVDARSDVWAVGATLYFLLTGSAPYEGASEAAALAKLLSGAPPAPLPFGTPDAVVAIVEQALARPVDRRIASAAELQVRMVEALAVVGATSTSDVARFVEEHVGERARQRKVLVQAALEAARDRERQAGGSLDRSSMASARGPGTGEVSGWGSLAATRAPPSRRRVLATAAVVVVTLAGVGALAFTLASRGPSAAGSPARTSATSASPTPSETSRAAATGTSTSSTGSAATDAPGAPSEASSDVAASPPSTAPAPSRSIPPRPHPAARPTGAPVRTRDYGF